MTLPCDMTPMYLTGLCVLVLALLLHIIGLATPNWSSHGGGQWVAHCGLWECCRNTKLTLPNQKEDDDDDDEVKCGERPKNSKDAKDGNLDAVRACAILGLLTGLASILLAIVQVALNKKKILLTLTLSVCAGLLTTLLISVGLFVWSVEYHETYYKTYDHGYSFALCTTAAILFLVGGVLVLVAWNRDAKG